MSKAEHDGRAAARRGEAAHYGRPWYRSAAGVLERHGLRGLRCLDLCAGNAEFAEILRERFAMQVTCADYAPAHLAHQQQLGFDTLAVDLDAGSDAVDRAAGARAGAFDLVVSLATIEHVFDSDNFLSLCHTVLKPGGLLLVNTPNIAFAGYRLYSRLSGNRPFGEGHHVRFWDFRFLRTNLFLNGFETEEDARGFYGLPLDPLTRAFRGRRRLAGLAALPFHLCRVAARLPGCRGWSCDELTVLARRQECAPVGFQYPRVLHRMGALEGSPGFGTALARLAEAQRRGWLREHLLLNQWVTENLRKAEGRNKP